MTKLLTVLTMLFAGALLAAQEDASKSKEPDKEVAQKLKDLKAIAADKSGAHDAEAAPIITDLLKKHDGGMNEKDTEEVVRGLRGVLVDSKLRDAHNMNMYKAAAYALGQFKADGAKVLKELYKDHRFPEKPDWVPLREEFLKALGKTKDEASIKFLLDETVRNPEKALMAAGGEALGNFEGSKQVPFRREIVETMLHKYGELDSKSRVGDPSNVEAQNARDYLAVISDKWNTTLSKMTHQNHRTYPDWNTWYNKNKDTEWK
jgi:hypothetical protein